VASCHWFPFSKALMIELKLTWLGLTSVPSPEIPETPPDSAGMIQLACSKALQQSGFGPCFEWIWSMFFFHAFSPKMTWEKCSILFGDTHSRQGYLSSRLGSAKSLSSWASLGARPKLVATVGSSQSC